MSNLNVAHVSEANHVQHYSATKEPNLHVTHVSETEQPETKEEKAATRQHFKRILVQVVPHVVEAEEKKRAKQALLKQQKLAQRAQQKQVQFAKR